MMYARCSVVCSPAATPRTTPRRRRPAPISATPQTIPRVPPNLRSRTRNRPRAANDEEVESATALALKLKSARAPRRRSAGTPCASQKRPAPSLTPEEQQTLDTSARCRSARWFEFTTNQQGATVRRKLAWFSTLTGRCLFVNQARRTHRRENARATRARHRAQAGEGLYRQARVAHRSRMEGDHGLAQAIHGRGNPGAAGSDRVIEHRRSPRKPPGVIIQVTNVMTGEVIGRLGNISAEGMMLRRQSSGHRGRALSAFVPPAGRARPPAPDRGRRA